MNVVSGEVAKLGSLAAGQRFRFYDQMLGTKDWIMDGLLGGMPISGRAQVHCGPIVMIVPTDVPVVLGKCACGHCQTKAKQKLGSATRALTMTGKEPDRVAWTGTLILENGIPIGSVAFQYDGSKVTIGWSKVHDLDRKAPFDVLLATNIANGRATKKKTRNPLPAEISEVLFRLAEAEFENQHITEVTVVAGQGTGYKLTRDGGKIKKEWIGKLSSHIAKVKAKDRANG